MDKSKKAPPKPTREPPKPTREASSLPDLPLEVSAIVLRLAQREEVSREYRVLYDWWLDNYDEDYFENAIEFFEVAELEYDGVVYIVLFGNGNHTKGAIFEVVEQGYESVKVKVVGEIYDNWFAGSNVKDTLRENRHRQPLVDLLCNICMEENDEIRRLRRISRRRQRADRKIKRNNKASPLRPSCNYNDPDEDSDSWEDDPLCYDDVDEGEKGDIFDEALVTLRKKHYSPETDPDHLDDPVSNPIVFISKDACDIIKVLLLKTVDYIIAALGDLGKDLQQFTPQDGVEAINKIFPQLADRVTEPILSFLNQNKGTPADEWKFPQFCFSHKTTSQLIEQHFPEMIDSTEFIVFLDITMSALVGLYFGVGARVARHFNEVRVSKEHVQIGFKRVEDLVTLFEELDATVLNMNGKAAGRCNISILGNE